MRRARIALGSWGLLLGCASSTGSWYEELLAREAAAAAPHVVASEDGFFRTRVSAQLATPIEDGEEAYSLRLDMGAGQPVECWLYRGELDLAFSVAEFSRATFDAISQQLGAVEVKKVDRVDTGAFRGSPYLALDWLYRVKQEGARAVGQVKHVVATKGARSVYCQHNESGYRESFRRLVAGLVETLEYGETGSPAPYYSEVSTLAIEGTRIGVERMTLTLDAEGDTKIARSSSLLLPVDGETLRTTDSYDVEYSRSDGALINQAHVESANGELVTELRLDPDWDGAWKVSGTFRTKPLEATIRLSEPLASSLGEALALRRALEAQGPAAELTLRRWIPQADPTRLTDQTIAIRDEVGEDRFLARVSMGPIDADLVVDRTGKATSGSVDMGFTTIEIERVFVDGEF